MLDLYGSSYVIEHVVYEYNAHAEMEVFRSYTADMLLALNRQLGLEFSTRYSDVIKKEIKEDEPSTGDEIAMQVIKRAGLKGKSNGHNDLDGEARP